MRRTNRIITCTCGCGQVGEYAARDLIRPCYAAWYQQAKRDGTFVSIAVDRRDTSRMRSARTAQHEARLAQYAELATTITNRKVLARRIGVSVETIHHYARISGPPRPVPDMAEMVKRRKWHSIRQQDLAVVLGLSKQAISVQERPRKHHLATLYAYEDALNALIAERENTRRAA